MEQTTTPPVEQKRIVRPVVHRDGRRGQCECRKHGYTIKWDDGEVKQCVDVSYALASFTDLPRRKPSKDIPTPNKARSYQRGEWRHFGANSNSANPPLAE